MINSNQVSIALLLLLHLRHSVLYINIIQFDVRKVTLPSESESPPLTDITPEPYIVLDLTVITPPDPPLPLTV